MTLDPSALPPPPESASEPPRPPFERNSLVTWAGLAAIALLLVAYLVFRQRLLDAVRGEHHVAVGQKLAIVDLHPLTGDVAAVTANDLQGKVTLLNVWGTWCPPCAIEFPYLAAIWQRFQKDEEFQYLSVSCRHDGEEIKNLDELRAETVAFLASQRVDHPTYYDPGFATRTSLEMLGAFNGYPTTVVLDRDGIIRGVWESPDGIPQVEKLVGELLEQKSAK
jgi:thiol-disulfide isomerase/thioredoxin